MTVQVKDGIALVGSDRWCIFGEESPVSGCC